jgi:anti-anti-sigma regulatory factor
MALVFDERSGDTHRLTCLEPDLTNPDRLRDLSNVIGEVLASSARSLVLDLTRVREADSKLVGMLLHVKRAATDREVRLRIFLSERIEQWVTVCRVEFLLANPSPEPGTEHSHPPRVTTRTTTKARLAG